MSLAARSDFPVLLTFDLDAELLWTSRDPKNWERPIALSQGAYGYREGVPRILDLLARHGIECTFFVPGMIIERNRALVENIYAAGHEIAHHSYSHRWLQDMEEPEEREEFEKTNDLIAGLTGSKPLGWRSPAAEFSKNTMRLLLEYGFLYSSNFFDRDEPYKHDWADTELRLYVPIRLGPGRCAFFPIQHPIGWPRDDAALRRIRALVGGVRSTACREKSVRACHASSDHRAAFENHVIGPVDPAYAPP